jgi:hypothetical protein
LVAQACSRRYFAIVEWGGVMASCPLAKLVLMSPPRGDASAEVKVVLAGPCRLGERVTQTRLERA